MILKHFKNLVDPEILGLMVVLLVLCPVMTLLFGAIMPGFAAQRKSKFFPYVVVLILVYGLITFLVDHLVAGSLGRGFAVHASIMLGLGTLHVYFYRIYFRMFGEENVWKEGFFTLTVTLYAMVPFVLCHAFLNGPYFTLAISKHAIFFLAPTWFYASFAKMLLIPPTRYLTWNYPDAGTDIPDHSSENPQDMVVVAWRITRTLASKKVVVLKAKAPSGIPFGHVFYKLIEDYNQHHAQDDAIEGYDLEQSYGWVFFLETEWHRQSKGIKPLETLNANGIRDNDVIFCMRMERSVHETAGQNEKARDFPLTKK